MKLHHVVLAVATVSAAPPMWANPGQITAADLADLPAADVVILGEVHDNPVHHRNQADAIRAIGARALVVEMLTDAEALKIRPEHLESADTLSAVLGWQESGWPDFSMYYPVFTAVSPMAIFGGAVDISAARQAVADGAAGVFGEAASLFGLDRALDDPEQSEREAEQMRAHCGALPASMLSGIVEGQRLRDAALARAVIAAYSETGGPVVVITGNGHARRDWGIPRSLEFAAPDLTVLTVGQLEVAPDGNVPFDLWLVTGTPKRADPCAVFAVE